MFEPISNYLFIITTRKQLEILSSGTSEADAVYTGRKFGESTYPEWFTDVTEKHGGSDPLYRYETYKYVFGGEERIKLIQLHHRDKVDIVLEQFFLQRDGSQALM